MEKLTEGFYQFAFYVPESHLNEVKEALFAIGVGVQGNYDKACWQCLGQGQFRPSETANPTIGNQGALCYVPEYKVEMLCKAVLIEQAIKQLQASHPYEEPAYSVIRLGL